MVVLGGGKVVADGTVDEIRGVVGLRRVSLTIGELPDLAGIRHVEQSDGRTHVLTPDADQFVRDLVRSEVTFRDLEVRPTSLEDAFLSLVKENAR